MHPQIDKTKFGSITINHEEIENDVIIRLDGEVKKRKKKLSKRVYGTSHIVSLEEAEYIYEEGVDSLIFGTGQSGMAMLSKEAADFFREKNCQVKMLPTPEAILAWNESEGAVIGLFHITC